MRLENITRQLGEASFRNIFFFVDTSEVVGGRRDFKHEIADSDIQVIEDLGLRQKTYTIKGTIAAREVHDKNRPDGIKIITTYKQARNGLLQALDKKGPGILVHPWYGTLNDMVCRTYTISENMTNIGIANITMVFEISNEPITVRAIVAPFSGMSLQHQIVLDTVDSMFAKDWKVERTFAGELKKAIDKGNEFVDAVNKATEPLASLADKIDGHAKTVTDFATNISSLVENPTNLADSLRGVLSSVGAVIATVDGTYEAFKRLFDFGDGDTDLQYNTASAIRQNLSTITFNSGVQGSALSYAYLNAGLRSYTTIDEIKIVQTELEIQFDKIFANTNISSDLIESLVEMRVVTQNFLEEKKLTAKQIVTVNVGPISIRNLSFAYYGNSDFAEDIADLNGLHDIAYFQGDIEIITA